MKKRLLSIVLALSMLLACLPANIFAATATATFSDVPTNHWAYEAVEFCYSKGLVKGTSETTFSPDDTISYIQFLVMLGRVAYEEQVELATTEEDNWYTAYIRTASEVGVLDQAGTSTAKSILENPSRYLVWSPTRQYMAIRIYKAMEALGQLDRGTYNYPYFSSLSDTPSTGFDSYFAWCLGTGILTGMDDGTFDYDGLMTRAQAAVVMYRLYQFLYGEWELPTLEIDADTFWDGSLLADDPPHWFTQTVSTYNGHAIPAGTYLISGTYVVNEDGSTSGGSLACSSRVSTGAANTEVTIKLYLIDGTEIVSYTGTTDKNGHIKIQYYLLGTNFGNAYYKGTKLLYVTVETVDGNQSGISNLFTLGSNWVTVSMHS